MNINDLRCGDRFEVTFTATVKQTTTPTGDTFAHFKVGEAAGLDAGFVVNNATTIKPINPVIVPGALYMAANGAPYQGSRAHGGHVHDFLGHLYGPDDDVTGRPLPAGLRRARLIPEDDA